MYKTYSQLKQDARLALSGKWGVAILIEIVLFAIILIPTMIFSAMGEGVASIFSLVSPLFTIVLSVGFCYFSLKLCTGMKEQTSVADLFHGFKAHPGKAILLYLLIFLYMLPAVFIYMIAVSIITFSAIRFNVTGTVSAVMVLALIVLTVFFMIYAYYIQYTYAVVYYILLDYPDLSVGQIWKRSKLLMKGNRLRLFGLQLSFIGWVILAVLSLGIGMLWLAPYMGVTQAAFYLDLVQKQPYRKQYEPTPAPTSTNATADTTLTHDCEEAHGNSFESSEKEYTGIDPDTFN